MDQPSRSEEPAVASAAESTRHLNVALSGRYEIVREIGSGGMATVYLCRDLRHGRDVAVKVVRREIMSTVVRERFAREIEIAARLNHPHILTLHDSGDAHGVLFYVMPLISGESLRTRLNREGRLTVDEALRITRQIASALDHAHAENIVHRDLKPENILLHRGDALVADFGIALALGADRRLTTAGFSIGTPEYMSPEQAAGEFDLDGRSDVYSLGCIVFEMLTGKTPFSGGSLQAILSKRFLEPAPLVSRLRPEVPLSVAHGVRKAMENAPEARFASAGEFVKAMTPQPVSQQLKSVAVLPFLNLSADPENEYFADGIAEDVIAQLAKIRSLKVIARSSVMPFKKRDQTMAEIAGALGVTTILDGSVRRSGNRVRIVAQLVDAATAESLWVETYDRDLTDIFAIQSDVALQIATALRAELSTDERIRIRREPTRNIEAYQLYTQARFWFGRFTSDGSLKSIEYLEKAIALDPQFAGAYSALALAYAETAVGTGGFEMLPSEAYAKAFTLASKALELDPASGDAHEVLGFIKFVRDLDWAGAEAEFKHALELSPGSADTYDHYAWLCGSMERYEEAVGMARRAKELDPLTHVTDLAAMLLRAGRYDEALEEAKRNVEFDPRLLRARSSLGWAHMMLGQTADGIAELERAVAMSGESDTLFRGQLGLAYGIAGRTEDARAILRKMQERAETHYVSPSHLAYAYVGLGEHDLAIDQLEVSYEQRAGNYYGMKGSFLFHPLRSHPRFVALIKKMGLA